MKLRRLDETKKLFPHFYDKTSDSNFTKHLSIINNQQLDLYHKLKTIDWSRSIEKPIQIWKEQDKKYDYTMHFKVLIPNLKEVNIYKNPIILDDLVINGELSKINSISRSYKSDNTSFYESTYEGYTETIINSSEINDILVEENILPNLNYQSLVFLKELPSSEDDLYELKRYDLSKTLLIIENDDSYDVYRKDDENNIFIKIYSDLNKVIKEKYNISLKRNIIPKDTFVVEVITWDDYRWLKGFPENDYVKQDSSTMYNTTLHYRDSESFINISIEEISYSKYLTFRVHQDGIRHINILKNENIILEEDFSFDLTTNKQFESTDFSYRHFDFSDEDIFDRGYQQYEIETKNGRYMTVVTTEQDEYIYRLLLKDSDFLNNDFTSNILKDVYDIEVTVFEKRYKCNKERLVTYNKRYNGYDNVLGDCFDHDYSLDMIGTLFNVPRFHFYPVLHSYLYSSTYPTFNDRVSEDDYHYMKRIQYYISNYNHIYFPVLEFWKYYYTDSELVNRKVKLAKQGQAYFRTSEEDNCFVMGDALIEEEFSDEEYVEEYSNIAVNTTSANTQNGNSPSFTINKATNIYGKAKREERVSGYYWAESVIINKLFIVPSANYRLRYGVTNNKKDVTVLIYGYTRDGQLIRSNEFIASDDDSIFYKYDENDEVLMEYTTREDYKYYNLELSMPSDTSYIEVLLQSDDDFEYNDVTFERETIALKENLYLDNNEGYYNSCTYDLYATYYDIPSNLRLNDTERFNSLFNRSLPLTKQGVFHLIIDETADTTLYLSNEYTLHLKDLYGNIEKEGDGDNHYIIDITDFIKEGCNYHISFHCLLNEHFNYEFINGVNDDETQLLSETPEYLIKSYIEWYDIDDFSISEEGMLNHLLFTDYCEKKVDNDIEGIVSYSCTAVDDSIGARIHIVSDHNFKYWDLKFKRDEELTEEELSRGRL